MSYSTSIGEPAHATARPATAKTLLAGWIDGVGGWLERRRQWQALRELDDRLLADVGISAEDAFRTAGRPLHDESVAVVAYDHRS
jgi:uncharacterized protein YjiS (DUF1127 family)